MMEFLSPWSLAGLALVPSVFLWGLLAPRGRPVRVGSLMLWHRVLPEGAAGKPSARVRLRDPLIWLDAAAVLLVVLACSRPALKTFAPAEPVATLVIDRSAHMRPECGGKHEYVWYNAYDRAGAVLQALGDAPIRVVFVPGGEGTVEAETVRTPDFAARGAGPWEPLLVVSDLWPVVAAESAAHGDLPLVAVTDLAPAAKTAPNVYVLATGRESRNVGLRRIACRIEADRWWLLASARAAPGAAAAPLVVMGDDKVLATVPDFLSPGAEVERVLAMDAPLPTELYVGLAGRGDDFPDDNAAYLTLAPAGRLRIALIGSPDPALRRALAACDDTEVTEVPPKAKVRAAQADLLIACGEAIPADWTEPAVTILPLQAVGLVRPVGGEAAASAPEWRVVPGHPLAQALYLEPPRLTVARRYAFDTPADLLLGTTDAPLMVTWHESGSRRLAVLFGFDEPSTDWTRRAGFPVFWSRALEWLVPKESRAAGYTTYRPFELLSGSSRRAPGRPGFFGGDRGARFGASFIGTDEGFRFGPGRDDLQAAIEAIRRSVEAKRRAALSELWPYLAAAALIVLLARARVAR